jgi:hypothetical protein
MSMLERRVLPGRLTEVEYLQEVFVFANVIVNENGTVQELSYPRAFPNRASHTGKARQ